MILIQSPFDFGYDLGLGFRTGTDEGICYEPNEQWTLKATP